jgi:isopenicillin N synthase-like dioxygenase
MSIPLISLEKLDSSDENIRRSEMASLDQACREIGFFYLTDTGIPQSLINQIMDTAQRFFAKPLDEKLAINIIDSPNHRGYGGIGEEQLDELNAADWKETFDMALDVPSDHYLVEQYPTMYGPNQYPDDAAIVTTLQTYYAKAFDASQKLLTAIARTLKLEDDFFTRHFNTHVTVLRMIHYPPRPEATHDNGAGAHTDYGCVTLLLQDQIGGLQVKHRNGEWIDATPMSGALVVNIGDLMQRWTNDEYVSTAHRVTAPPAGVHRYSIPFFVEPDYETQVSCVPTCQSQDKPARYKNVQAGDWIQSRFNATYQYREDKDQTSPSVVQ